MNKPINKHPMYFQRLNRDVTDLLSHNFNCSSSCLSVLKDQNGITLNVCILEGPYRRGHFSFFLDIPINYPFKSVDVWAKHPIWHPNVDLLTGRVFLPLDWSPVLTLNSLALAVQMMLLEPSTDNALNIEASTYYNSDQMSFEQQVQATLQGCRYVGVDFPSVVNVDCAVCGKKSSSFLPKCQPSDLSNNNSSSNSNSSSGSGREFCDNVMEIIPNYSPKRRKRCSSEVEDDIDQISPAFDFLKPERTKLVSTARITSFCGNSFAGNDSFRRFLGTSELERKALRDYQGESLKKRVKAAQDELSSFDELSIEKDISILSKW